MTAAAKMGRVLLTGGGGFLGAWIVKLLNARGIAVRVFELKEDHYQIESIAPEAADTLEWIVGDVSDSVAMTDAAKQCDAIIHLAGLMTPACIADPILGAKVNVIGTLCAFEAAKANGIAHVTYTSSGGVFGLEDAGTPYPLTHYGAYKLANEGNARAYWTNDGIASFGFRPFVIYGPGRDAGLTADLSLACAAAVRGEPFEVSFSGAVALVYVEDVALAFVEAATQQPSGARTANLTGHATSVEETVELIRSIADFQDISIKGPNIPSLSTVTNDWTRCGLDLPPETTLIDGLKNTLKHSSV